MSETSNCPGCGQRFKLKPELAGKRVKCPKCGQPFLVPAVTPSEPVVVPLFEEESLAAAAPAVQPAAQHPQPAARKPAGESVFTKIDKDILRIGGGMVAVGVAALVLPLFGLQVRKLQSLGNQAGIAGFALAVIGGLICVVVLARRRPRMALAAGGGIVGTLIVVGMSVKLLGKLLRPKFDQNPAPIAANQAKPVTYDSLVAEFGREKVAQVTIAGATGMDAATLVNERAQAVLAGKVPFASTVEHHPDRLELILAPVDDLTAALATLDLGSVQSTDLSNRSAVIAFDSSKLPAP